jgi:hypothetical protein
MFTILSNSLFLLFIFGALVLVARRLPEAARLVAEEEELHKKNSQALQSKGLPVPEFNYFPRFIAGHLKSFWKSVLEAKGLVPAAKVRYRIKKIFRSQSKAVSSGMDIVPTDAPAEAPVKISEAWLLDQIKQHPGDQNLYFALGNLYMQRKSYKEAIGIFTVPA